MSTDNNTNASSNTAQQPQTAVGNEVSPGDAYYVLWVLFTVAGAGPFFGGVVE